MNRLSSFFLLLTPGIIMAMAGVGVGDLATASIAGSTLGTTVLWAAFLGAFMKFFITEGCARWQLATGQTILEGCKSRMGLWFKIPFFIYFVLWSYFVSAALISASGVAATAIYPLCGEYSKMIYGATFSLIAGLMVLLGGFKLFAKVMQCCCALLFVTVLVSLFQFDLTTEHIKGLLAPSIPLHIPQSVNWTIALIGGVGGTLTVICYGYWIAEVGRVSTSDLKKCRIDLAVGYLLTSIFGAAMVILGSMVELGEGKGMNIILQIGNILGEQSGTWAGKLFLVGAWGAIFSSMLGVWQSAPYIFADFISNEKVDLRSAHKNKNYRWWLLYIVFVPMLSLLIQFTVVQKCYSYFGALVVPCLTCIILFLCRKKNLGSNGNKPITIAVGLLILLFFAYMILGLGIIPS